MKTEAEVTIEDRLKGMEEELYSIKMLLLEKAQVENKLGWLSEEETMAITQLKRTRLYQLRVQGKILASSFNGKAVFYSLSSLRELLETNARNQ